MRVLQATLQGCDLDLTRSGGLPDTAHLINKWNPIDTSTNLVNRYFHLLTFNQNHDSQGWTGTFREAVDLTIEKNYDNHEFKYKQ